MSQLHSTLTTEILFDTLTYTIYIFCICINVFWPRKFWHLPTAQLPCSDRVSSKPTPVRDKLCPATPAPTVRDLVTALARIDEDSLLTWLECNAELLNTTVQSFKNDTFVWNKYLYSFQEEIIKLIDFTFRVFKKLTDFQLQISMQTVFISLQNMRLVVRDTPAWWLVTMPDWAINI